ncbi:hypothetical protein BJ878DRAFT_257547 [Calycina marina]|uniref:Uncharacterized protein n=1 Tax=Calycina marina TaxID=1763456 RepID=A0A9P7YW75_9HELO|nr:hypothetical protein BJ878DRAFT_257547 [Calycina marina]
MICALSVLADPLQSIPYHFPSPLILVILLVFLFVPILVVCVLCPRTGRPGPGAYLLCLGMFLRYDFLSVPDSPCRHKNLMIQIVSLLVPSPSLLQPHPGAQRFRHLSIGITKSYWNLSRQAARRHVIHLLVLVDKRSYMHCFGCGGDGVNKRLDV